MDVTRGAPKPAPQPDVNIRLTYEEAQILHGLMNLVRRVTDLSNFRGSPAAFVKACMFTANIRIALRDAGVEDYRER